MVYVHLFSIANPSVSAVTGRRHPRDADSPAAQRLLSRELQQLLNMGKKQHELGFNQKNMGSFNQLNQLNYRTYHDLPDLMWT